MEIRASICPFSSQICRGPECPLLIVEVDREGALVAYYCGANNALPSGVSAMPIVSPREAREAAASAANTDGGRVEQNLPADSTSHDNRK